MKRFLKVLFLAVTLPFFMTQENVFCQEAESDEYIDDYIEAEANKTQNGKGDQFIAIRIMPLIPLNFDKQLYVGGGISIGYHKFLNEHFAVGADVMFSYNTTIGSNLLTLIPFTIGITYQPYFGKFEFPINLNIGAVVESYLQYNYFPGLILKGNAGCFYRMNENWSFGLEGHFLYLPQWFFKDASKNDKYLAVAFSLAARYHF